MIEKLSDSLFINDMQPLILSGTGWNPSKAAELIMNHLLPLLPGKPYKLKDTNLISELIAVDYSLE